MTPGEAGSPDGWIEAVLEGWRRGQQLSAVGPGDVAVHLDHARTLAPIVGEAGRALDLGTGIGIPGLALAVIVADLGWADRVSVVHERAEVAGRRADLRGSFDVVVARAFGTPAVTAECAAPFVRLGGRIVVTEPPEASANRWPAEGLATLGLGRGAAITRPHAQLLLARAPVPERFPRRPGRAGKRPLW